MTEKNKQSVDVIQSAIICDIEDTLGASDYSYSKINEMAQVLLTLEKAKGEEPKIMNWGKITTVSDNSELNITQEGNQ
jgi:hypothetical protein